ncbi:para-hydroxybenzoate--polyprenyltransferase, putative [Plasmodium knowlesi strain H]|uniref:Para-hydroxybenzoate--polyprenyltransferase, putative n=3 Tax=Plasmodium knowlesi TaxID=5850 RepID=A0A5K1V6U4_PLAKH|nr:4-hydroxybenzoate polyprenyltransferase, putative [Plasmodium knowlesi strain H]OTN64440.1 putative Para-hydroxybenzoate--polyprenyltransferase [Plasmodium knowlesi]CAA9989254.1 4-hydroxybenzoate polyprenyltransferase, putative [Plasmodium knowlesi strain H]SBO26178.1 para-hydroxybenzoate--polyprenyltransferase, putative [Plasmodium knowlesi strain H]SBO26985.1 para-hydroxybenzoate--polyprenyltransferase, putative [Plasmodium knowlesi strain H]VVS78728.1 4-hydroxybenzoate polyprenyltransfer|eukprot:XP_002261600.1 para-hydroxybenzoate--polyprenyltransferase,putative [Plasmodium knowlesi strain H]
MRNLSKGLSSMKSIPVKGVNPIFTLNAGKAKKSAFPPTCNGMVDLCRRRTLPGIASTGVDHTGSNQGKNNFNRERGMMMYRYYSVSTRDGHKSQRVKLKVDRSNDMDNPGSYQPNDTSNNRSPVCDNWLMAIPLPNKVKQNLSAYITLSRLHIPTGVYLLLNSALYGYFLTLPVENLFISPGNELNWEFISKIGRDLALFTFGSINSRIAGCIINDLLDRNFDKHVERTKNRPLANNSVTTSRAFTYLGIHSALSLLTLFQFSSQTIYTGLVSTAFIISYPLMKRITCYAQVYLSITFNLGFLISSSVNVQLAANVFPLCVSFLPLCYLTIIYDTIYAHQDRKDDIKLNLKSLAIKWGDNTLKYSKLLAINMIYLFYLSGYLFDMHYSYYVMSTCNVLYLLHCIKGISLHDREKCMAFFKNSKNILILFALSAFVAKGCQAYQRWEEGTQKDHLTGREDTQKRETQEGSI